MKRELLSNAKEVRDWFSCDPVWLALDTETTSLNYYELECLGVSLCDGKRTCYVDLEGSPDRAATIQALREALPKVGKLIFHNAPFDMKVLHKLGIGHTETIFCTMTAAHLLDENNSCGLKELAGRILGQHRIDFAQASEQGTQSEQFFTYAMNDAEDTWLLYESFLPRLEEEGLSRLFFEIEMPFQFTLRDMEIHGVLVDRERLESMCRELQKRLGELYVEVLQKGNIPYSVQMNMFGEPEIVSSINLNSPTQMVEHITGSLSVELTQKTDSGAYSVDKHVLESLTGQHPFFAALAEYRAAYKLSTAFLEKLPKHIDPDGRIRSSFNNCVAVTGRLSSSGPNLQQLPKKGKKSVVDVRSVFIAPPRKVFVVADYSGQELRVLAHETKDLCMMDAFFKGKDVHLMIANEFFELGIPERDLFESSPNFEKVRKQFKEQRDRIKTVNFGLAYGKSAVGFAADWNIPKEEAQAFIDHYFEKFPRIKEAIERSTREVKEWGFVRNLAGRKRRLSPSNRAFRQAFNHKIQGASADMLRAACNLIRPILRNHPEWDAKIVLLVHDEIIVECLEDHADDVEMIVNKCMCAAMELCVPLAADVGIGKTYSEAK